MQSLPPAVGPADARDQSVNTLPYLAAARHSAVGLPLLRQGLAGSLGGLLVFLLIERSMRASELYSLATRMPAHANAMVRNSDGSVSLGAAVPAAAPAGPMLQNGVIVVDGGTISHHPEAPAAASAPNPMESALRRMQEPPVKGPVNLVGAPPGALFLPTGIRIR